MVTIIYEDEFIVVINKPNDMVVHHAKYSRNVTHEVSVLQTMEREFNLVCYPIHRLDRRTSGIILLAKKRNFVAKFQELFTANLIQKTYFGIVRGFSPDEKTITSPVKGRDANAYKDAETHLETIDQIVLDIPVKPYPTSRYSLVKLSPKTGRLHQLRIHMNKISHPLIGDGKYGDKNHNEMFKTNFASSNLFLHAYSLEFEHPFLKENKVLKADFNSFWKEIFVRFKWKL